MQTRWLVAFVLVGCSSSAGDPGDDTGDPLDVDGQNGACTAYEGRMFESVEQRECGLGPGGVIMCNWKLDFSALDPQRSHFSWHHSDTVENGAVRCTGKSITTDGIGAVHTGSYDTATSRLTWDTLLYQLP